MKLAKSSLLIKLGEPLDQQTVFSGVSFFSPSFPKNEAFCGRKKGMENERKRKSPDQTVFDGALFASS